jgi:hypothetical protein
MDPFLSRRDFQSVAWFLNWYAQKRESMVSIASVGVAKERQTAKGKRMTSRKGEQKKEGERGETNGSHQGYGVVF